jgi:hypothetical protein
MMSNLEIEQIESLAHYMAWVDKNRPEGSEHEHILFYRGHADVKFQLMPSVYRIQEEKSFRDVEHQLYEEMLRHSPTVFRKDKTIFERLVRMQHYGLPTRLLDLTLNPLIALYFACCDQEKKDGEVILFPRKKIVREVGYPSDIPDTVLAGIEQAANFTHITAGAISWFKWFLKPNFERISQNHFELQNFHIDCGALMDECVAILDDAESRVADLLITARAIGAVENAVEKFVGKWIKYFHDIWNDISVPQEIRIQAKEANLSILNFSNHFADCRTSYIQNVCRNLHIKYNKKEYSIMPFLQEFTCYFFVLPTINNERIRNQQGAFIICPPGKSACWSIEQCVPNLQRITIKSDKKNDLLKELARIGITRSFVYPEMPELAKHIKSLYPARADGDMSNF